jgi:hypothetical protein
MRIPRFWDRRDFLFLVMFRCVCMMHGRREAGYSIFVYELFLGVLSWSEAYNEGKGVSLV